MERRVILLGRRNDTANLLAAADALALPSLFEAFGNVVLEGMASGLPVLDQRTMRRGRGPAGAAAAVCRAGSDERGRDCAAA